ncbi:WD40 repeat-like protein, partial [Artomyces pyxidatus]
HPSFADFMTHKNRCGEKFWINTSKHHLQLAKHCLQVMKQHLCFNICHLSDFTKMNDEIENLDQLIEQNIPAELKYACQFWAEHVVNILPDDFDLLADAINGFLRINFINWLECSSLCKLLKSCLSSFQHMSHWISQNVSQSESLLLILRDAMQFLTIFWQPITLCAIHIHISCVPFTPRDSLISKWYYKQDSALLKVYITGKPYTVDYYRVLEGHQKAVTSFALSPDGLEIISGSLDKTVIIWNVITGEMINQPLTRDKADEISAVSYSPDGSKVYSRSVAGRTRVWDKNTGASLRRPKRNNTYMNTSKMITAPSVNVFSPDRLKLAFASISCRVLIADVESGAVIQQLQKHINTVCAIAWSPDSSLIVSASHGYLGDSYFVVSNIETKSTIDYVYIQSHALCETYNTIAFSPDATTIVFAFMSGILGFWNLCTKTLSLKHSQCHSGHVTAIAFSPDGKYVVSASQDHSLTIWNATTGDTIKKTLTGHLGIIYTVIFLPGGLQIASGSDDTTVRFWDIQPYIQAGTKDNNESDTITSIAISPSGSKIVYGLKSSTNNLKILNILPQHTQAVSLKGHSNPVTALSFSHSRSHILSGSQDKTLKLWNCEIGNAVSLKGHSNPVTALSFSHSRSYILSGSRDKTLKLWNCETGNVIQTFTGSNLKFEITALAFSSDDLYIVSAAGRAYRERGITVWDTITGSILGGPFRAHKINITSIAFSCDLQYVYSGSYDCSIKLWDWRSAVKDEPINPDDIMASGIDYTGELMFPPFKIGYEVGDASLSGMVFKTLSKRALLAAINAGSSSAEHLLPVVDQSGWVLRSECQRLCWIPKDLRNRLAAFDICGPLFASGSENGVIVLLDASALLEPLSSNSITASASMYI